MKPRRAHLASMGGDTVSFIFPGRYYYGIAYADGRPVLLRRFRKAWLRDNWVAGARNRSTCNGHAVEVQRARLDPDGWDDDRYLL